MLWRASGARVVSTFVTLPRIAMVLVTLAGFGCAYGTEIDGGGGIGGSAGVGLPGGTQASTQGPGAQAASTHNAVASTTTSTKASSGASTGSGSSAAGMPNCNPIAANSCQAADDIGSVAGDDGGSVNDTGAGSRWVKAHVTEEDGSIFESDLSYTVSLSAAGAVEYDLFVHRGPDDGGPDCNAAPMQGAGSGTKTVHEGWDDSQGIGGEDNSRWLSIEVRWVSGDCTLPWTLTVDGGT